MIVKARIQATLPMIDCILDSRYKEVCAIRLKWYSRDFLGNI